MRTRRLVVLSSLLPLLAACGSPGGGEPLARSFGPSAASTEPRSARKPTLLVAAHEDGSLVRVELGATTKVTTLIPDRESKLVYPTQVDGSRVVYIELTEGASEALYADAGVVDPRTGEHRRLTRGGRTVQLLFSPDRRHRYVVDSPSSAVATTLFRTDAGGGNRRTLIPEAPGFTLTRGALSPDGATLYIARTEDDQPSTLLAVDTATGAQRVVEHGTPFGLIADVVASPDGRLLALTVGDWARRESGPESHVALVPADGGEARLLESAADLGATGFSPDGGYVLLTHTTTRRGPDDYRETESVLALADVATGRIEPITGTKGLRGAVSVD